MKKQLNISAAGRKLSLNKKTISNLKSSEMSKYIGGASSEETCGGHCHLTGKGCHTYVNGNTCDGHKTCYYC